PTFHFAEVIAVSNSTVPSNIYTRMVCATCAHGELPIAEANHRIPPVEEQKGLCRSFYVDDIRGIDSEFSLIESPLKDALCLLVSHFEELHEKPINIRVVERYGDTAQIVQCVALDEPSPGNVNHSGRRRKILNFDRYNTGVGSASGPRHPTFLIKFVFF